MKEIKDLQKLIEERAKQKLRDDIHELRKAIRAQKLLKELPTPLRPRMLSETDDAVITIRDWHYIVDDRFERDLFNHWLPIYIERESAEFLQKVDKLKEDVDNLYNHFPNS